jgi:hypothetical protein
MVGGARTGWTVTGEPDEAMVSRPIRRGAVKRGPHQWHLVGGPPYYPRERWQTLLTGLGCRKTAPATFVKPHA